MVYGVMRTEEKLRKLVGEDRGVRAALARSAKVDSARVTRWIDGEITPNIYQLLSVARFFGVAMEYLADEEATEVVQPKGDLTADERRILDLARRVGVEDAYLWLASMPRVREMLEDGLSPKKPRDLTHLLTVDVIKQPEQAEAEAKPKGRKKGAG